MQIFLGKLDGNIWYWTFTNFITYWQALINTYPKHVPWKLSSMYPKVSQLTSDFRVTIIMLRPEPSFFM
jgi:hypothetical protein